MGQVLDDYGRKLLLEILKKLQDWKSISLLFYHPQTVEELISLVESHEKVGDINSAIKILSESKGISLDEKTKKMLIM